MNKTLWIAVPTVLWAAQLHAQAAPAAPAAAPKTPAPAAAPAAATPTAKPAPTPAPTAAKPAAPAAAPAAATPAAKPAAAAANDKSVEWTLDPSHSHINFTARHLGFSKASGSFKKFAANIKADPKTAKLTALEATAETASIDTGIEKRDAHLKSDDFFNADKYPQLKLVLKSIKWNGNKFTATTDLTIRDVTKSVPFKGELLGTHLVNFGQGPQQRAGYEATATVNRKDFGLKWSMVTEGIAVVADPVQLDLAIEINYVPPTAAPTAAAPAPAATTPAATAAAPSTAKPAPAASTPAAAPGKPATAAAKPTTPAGAVAHADKPATATPAATTKPAPAPAAPAQTK